MLCRRWLLPRCLQRMQQYTSIHASHAATTSLSTPDTATGSTIETVSGALSEQDSSTAAAATATATKRRRTAVGHYRTSFTGDPELHLREFLPQTTSAASIPTAKRANLTTLFRRFRDVDQSDSAIRNAAVLLSTIDPARDIGNDVDFACLCLNSHHTFRIVPPVALLDHVANVIASRVKTSLQLEVIISAFHDMAEPTRTRDLLASLVPTLDTITGTLRKETVVFLACRLVDNGLAAPMLLQALQERAVMLAQSMTFHELAQLSLAFAVAPARPDDVKDVFENDYAPNLLRQIDDDVAAAIPVPSSNQGGIVGGLL
jgi:hypothetical protein